jgi:hypothetical protein
VITLMRTPSLSESAPPLLPPRASARERRIERANRFADQAVAEGERGRGPPEQAVRRRAEQALSTAIHQTQHAILVKREHCRIDLGHHRPQQSRRFAGIEALFPQPVAQRVDLEERQAQGIVRSCAARSHGEITFAKRGQHVGNGLERPDHSLDQQRRDGEPDHHQEHGERPTQLVRMRSEPE